MKYFLIVALLLVSFPNGVKANNQFGIDFNIPSAYSGFSSGDRYISGTLTAADKDSRYELAMPFFFHEHVFDSSICCYVHIQRVDLQLRSYRNSLRQGPYFGLTIRHSSVSGRDYNDFSESVSYDRFGVGVVLGFKKEVFNKLFWGANINVGRFLSEGELLANGSNDATFFGPTDNGERLFLNVEFLKLGVRF